MPLYLLLDNVYDTSRFPLEKQAQTARASRRFGLGITGLADALIMLGVEYGSEFSLEIGARAMRHIWPERVSRVGGTGKDKRCLSAVRPGAAHAERVSEEPAGRSGGGHPPLRHPQQPSHRHCADRNDQPAGEQRIQWPGAGISARISAAAAAPPRVAGNPQRRGLRLHAVRSLNDNDGKAARLSAALATVEQFAPERQLAMQAALHRYVDNAISKTINVPAEISFDSFSSIYEHAYDLGLKGCTIFRPSDVTGSILLAADSTSEKLCCSMDRAAD